MKDKKRLLSPKKEEGSRAVTRQQRSDVRQIWLSEPVRRKFVLITGYSRGVALLGLTQWGPGLFPPHRFLKKITELAVAAIQAMYDELQHIKSATGASGGVGTDGRGAEGLTLVRPILQVGRWPHLQNSGSAIYPGNASMKKGLPAAGLRGHTPRA